MSNSVLAFGEDERFAAAAVNRGRFGRRGVCWLWKRAGEYDHVVILEIGFATTEQMKRFVNSKSEHYLSNPWKDRFFVKQKDRYRYPVFRFLTC